MIYERIMELESFLKDLPIDLQIHIYDTVIEIRKPKQFLPLELKQDIETYHLLDHIIHNYKIMFNGTDHLGWVENAVINLMNDHRPIGLGQVYFYIHEDVRKAFPGLPDQEIATELIEGSHLQRLWRCMPPKKRIDLYLESYENIF